MWRVEWLFSVTECTREAKDTVESIQSNPGRTTPKTLGLVGLLGLLGLFSDTDKPKELVHHTHVARHASSAQSPLVDQRRVNHAQKHVGTKNITWNYLLALTSGEGAGGGHFLLQQCCPAPSLKAPTWLCRGGALFPSTASDPSALIKGELQTSLHMCHSPFSSPPSSSLLQKTLFWFWYSCHASCRVLSCTLRAWETHHVFYSLITLLRVLSLAIYSLFTPGWSEYVPTKLNKLNLR